MKKDKPFPGFAKCLNMMRTGGGLAEDGFQDILPHAGEYLDALMAAMTTETNFHVRDALLELIGYANSPRALPLFAEFLFGPEENLWFWAMWGLQRLNSKEARTILWEATKRTFPSAEETARFRELLDGMRKKSV